MTTFYWIGTDTPFTGTIPTTLELPIHKETPVPHAEVQIIKKGDPEYEEGVNRWMFLNGYATKEANEQEMVKEGA